MTLILGDLKHHYGDTLSVRVWAQEGLVIKVILAKVKFSINLLGLWTHQVASSPFLEYIIEINKLRSCVLSLWGKAYDIEEPRKEVFEIVYLHP